MKKALFVMLCAGAMACEKVVEIENPTPARVDFCLVDTALLGRWQSDSVWIETEVDTLDSLVSNRYPTLYYDLSVSCDTKKEFKLEYTNYGGAVTRDVYSTNYEAGTGAFYIYDPLHATRDTAQAGFVMRFQTTSDSTMTAFYWQDLGQGQQTQYRLFFRKL